MFSTEYIQNKLKQLRLVTLSHELPQLLECAEAYEMSYLQFAQQFYDLGLGARNSKRIEANRRNQLLNFRTPNEVFFGYYTPTICKKRKPQKRNSRIYSVVLSKL